VRWTAQDFSTFTLSKEYIDTVLIPMVPISFDERGKDAANGSEFIQMIAVEIERQFKGRILLLPSFVYFLNFSDQDKKMLLTKWHHELTKKSFKHLFFISSDQSWKSIVEELKGELIWIPSIPLEHLDGTNKMAIIDNQVKQLLNLFVEKWQAAEDVNG